MRKNMLWRTTATLAATGAVCLTVACGGSDKNTTGRSTTPESQQGQMPSSTQTTSSTYSGPTDNTTGNVPPSEMQTAPPPSQGETSTGGMNPGAAGGTTTSGQMGSAPSQTTGGTMGGGTAMQGDLNNLTDEQIVAVTSAANSGELHQAQLVKDHTQNAQIRRFAEHMIADHATIQHDEQRLLARAKIAPQQNVTSQQLATDSRNLVDTLRKEKNADFDRDYIDAQVREHRDLLNMLDNNLIPQAKNADLKSQLQTVRTKVEMHLREAEDIQKNLGTKP